MTASTLEERVSILERELLALKQQLPKPAAEPWWERIYGTFADVPAFPEAVALGRQYRESQRSAEDEDTDVSSGH